MRTPKRGDIDYDRLMRYPDFHRSCKVGDPVDGIGGYNCGHEVAPYREGMPSAFEGKLEGTGYTTAQVRELKARQRGLENSIRKDKREIEALKAAGLDDTEAAKRARKRLRAHQARLREHVAAHPKALRRENHRESIYETARKKAGAYGNVHLSAGQRKRVERAKTGEAARYEAARGEWEWRALEESANVVKPAKQNRHIPGTKEYERKVEQSKNNGYPAPSRITVSVSEAEHLVRENAGHGRPIISRGKWTGKERCMTDRVNGYVVDADGNETPTRGLIIHYAKNDAHIVPMKDEGVLFDEAL